MDGVESVLCCFGKFFGDEDDGFDGFFSCIVYSFGSRFDNVVVNLV